MNRRELLRLSGLSGGLALTVRSIPGEGATLATPPVYDPTLTFDERMVEVGIDQVLPRWEATGLLEGITFDPDRRTLARVLENQRLFNEHETRPNTEGVMTSVDHEDNDTEMRLIHFGTTADPCVRAISIPIVRRALGLIMAQGWLPLQAMVGPTGMFYYWRRRVRRLDPTPGLQAGYTSDAELIRAGNPYIYCKESEPINDSWIAYGDPYVTPERNYDIEAEAVRTASYATALADSVMDLSMANIIHNCGRQNLPWSASFGEDYHIEKTLAACTQIRDEITDRTFGGRRPGFFWAILPAEFQETHRSRLRLLEHRLKLLGFRVFTRRTSSAWEDRDELTWGAVCSPSIVIGFRGSRIGDNGYVSTPYIPVSLRGQGTPAENLADPSPQRLIMRWGHRLLREGTKFFGAVQLIGGGTDVHDNDV